MAQVVATFASGQCGRYPDQPCVLHVYGPFGPHDRKEMEKCFRDAEARGQRPHKVTMDRFGYGEGPS